MKKWVAVAVMAASLLAVAVGQPPMALKLERRLVNASTSQLVAIDTLRHTKLLGGGGAVQLPVIGSGNDYLAGGPYLTRVNLGSPPRSFSVIIDTGSSPSWVACQMVGSSTQPGLFDPRVSSSSSVLMCSDNRCKEIVHDRSGVCNTSSNSCGYNMTYGTGSDVLATAAGYFLSDMVYLEILNGSQQTSSFSAPIIFGCTDLRTGDLTHEAFDGILGFGPLPISFSSQVYSLGLSPRVFSLCMERSHGGGILVFGKALELGLVYTPLLRDQDYYELNLESISVNGKKLGLDPSVFTPSAGYQTFADSGTSLAFLASEAYDQFVSAIAAAVSPSANPTLGSRDQHCFVPSSSIDSSFPHVTLHFVGGAAMQLKPANYLRSRDNSIYCIAWQKNGQRVTILGDIVLSDKLLVHDIENMVLGWMDYNCSRPIHVTTTPEKKKVNSADASQKISMPIAIVILIILVSFSTPS
uniref:Uncharacterized protein n=2 Tax=Avena sativa TaxID=4498 RepID=A0ACD5W9T7_AVESA